MRFAQQTKTEILLDETAAGQDTGCLFFFQYIYIYIYLYCIFSKQAVYIYYR